LVDSLNTDLKKLLRWTSEKIKPFEVSHIEGKIPIFHLLYKKKLSIKKEDELFTIVPAELKKNEKMFIKFKEMIRDDNQILLIEFISICVDCYNTSNYTGLVEYLNKHGSLRKIIDGYNNIEELLLNLRVINETKVQASDDILLEKFQTDKDEITTKCLEKINVKMEEFIKVNSGKILRVEQEKLKDLERKNDLIKGKFSELMENISFLSGDTTFPSLINQKLKISQLEVDLKGLITENKRLKKEVNILKDEVQFKMTQRFSGVNVQELLEPEIKEFIEWRGKMYNDVFFLLKNVKST